MSVAPHIRVPREKTIRRLMTKEKPYVVDNSCGFARALADWVSGCRRRWTNPPASGCCPDSVNYQSGFRPEGCLALRSFERLGWIPIQPWDQSPAGARGLVVN